MIEREILRLVRRKQAQDSAWAAYEVARDIAKAAWLERGGAKGDPLYEAARLAAWATYEEECTAAFFETD